MEFEANERQLQVLITGFGPFKSIEENPSWLAVKQLHGTTLDLTAAVKLDRDGAASNQRSSRSAPARAASTARIQTLQVPVHYGSILDLAPRLHGARPTSAAAHFWHDTRLDGSYGGETGKSYPEGYPNVRHPQVGLGGRDTYDVVIHVGVGKTGSLRCETQAHKTGYNAPDANHCLAPIADVVSQSNKVRGFGQGYDEFGALEKTTVDAIGLVSWLKDIGMGDQEVEQSLDPGRYLCDFLFYCSLCESRRRNASGTTATDVIFIHVPPADQDLSIDRCRDAIRAIAWYIASRRLSP